MQSTRLDRKSAGNSQDRTATELAYAGPFAEAARHVFRTMLGLEVTTSPPQLKHTTRVSGEVTGIMGLAGDMKGTVTVSLTERAALLITGTLLGEEYDRVTPDVVDAVGELTNILLGRARSELEATGLRLSASLPTVVVGKDVEVNLITRLPIVSIPFRFSVSGENEHLFLDFSFE